VSPSPRAARDGRQTPRKLPPVAAFQVFCARPESPAEPYGFERSRTHLPTVFVFRIQDTKVSALRRMTLSRSFFDRKFHVRAFVRMISTMADLLEVRGLKVELPTPTGWVRPVNDVTLRIAPGESLGLVGESGSGKTMLALALMGLLPAGARVSGEALLAGQANGIGGASAAGAATPAPAHSGNTDRSSLRTNLTALSEQGWRGVRGREIAMVFQEPMTALNPVMRIGAQIAEAIRTHNAGLDSGKVRRRMLEALRRAAVPEPEARAEQFPHQLSGGLRQRAMIAMALAGGPRLLIADEPTTALDVTVQKQILDLLDRLRRELRLGLLFITHDLGVVAQVADRVAVVYAGRIIEEGPTLEVLHTPRHPYTNGLLAASPTLERGRLMPIPGAVPQLTALPPGCAFEPRCPLRVADCVRGVPDLRVPQLGAAPDHKARCILV
jgi:peptide/nickel transport system ATP-binding protein